MHQPIYPFLVCAGIAPHALARTLPKVVAAMTPSLTTEKMDSSRAAMPNAMAAIEIDWSTMILLALSWLWVLISPI